MAMRHSGGGGSSHAPHTPVAAASVRSKPGRTAAQLEALAKQVAQARALLPGSNTTDVLSHLPPSVVQQLEPMNVYSCELTAQYIFVVYGRTRFMSQVNAHAGSRNEQVKQHAIRVYSELHRLFFNATTSNGQPLCSDGERHLATKAAEEGWVGAAFIKMLAEVRVTVLLWSRAKLAAFLDGIFNFDLLRIKEEGLDWASLPITCSCFGNFTLSKSVSRIWKWGACSSALVIGLVACGCEEAIGEPLQELRQHVETVAAFDAENINCAQLDDMALMFVKARKMWSSVLKGEMARATAGLGQLDIAGLADQQHNHAQQLVIANAAAAGGQEQLLVHILAELNSKQQAAERARALPPQQAAAALPLDVMETTAVEEALYGTTKVAYTEDAAGREKIDKEFPGYLKEDWDLETAIMAGDQE